MPSSAAAASTTAKPLCFNDYVMRRKEGKRAVRRVGRERKKRKKTAGERQRDRSGFTENKANRDGERC